MTAQCPRFFTMALDPAAEPKPAIVEISDAGEEAIRRIGDCDRLRGKSRVGL